MQAISKKTAIIGSACVLPGASSKEAFWQLLINRKNAVAPRPYGRWSVERFLRPGDRTSGFSYSFAGGYLDNPFAFDPSLFGISAREAEQIDPQQRLLLETVWRAFEDARINLNEVKQQKVGVYIGASMVDYQSNASHDFAVMDAHFMTGNSMSILSNRISYIFDFHGPSLTVDTACSSSLVALHHARLALLRGEIDLAIVGGVNMLLSPIPFIGFSQARMLSPTGLSRPFSDDADGYVRSEGAVVIILRRADDAEAKRENIQGFVLDTAVNSDGRTSGISLPSAEGQEMLLRELYKEIDCDNLAFVEAHGTGTAVGDPIEASAIGASLAQARAAPLVIGSAKSNVGHLEPASGLVGLLKALLSLQHGLYPATLFCERPNSRIDFKSLNIRIADQPLPLQIDEKTYLAGVCNYGFGGTNAHVILEAARTAAAHDSSTAPKRQKTQPAAESEASFLTLSAASPEALKARAGQIASLLQNGGAIAGIAEAFAYHHKIFTHRLSIPISDKPLALARIQAYEHGDQVLAPAHVGMAMSQAPKLAFVYSGNGCQYPSMGQAVYSSHAGFRREIDGMEKDFAELFGWSIREALTSGVSDERIAMTSVAQPLIFAIQSALTSCLADYGVRPDGVIGHSVGEVAAAEACGALTRSQALQVIYHRSLLQEKVRGAGRMMVIACDHAMAASLIEMAECKQVEIAAMNSATSTTVAGPERYLKILTQVCRRQKIATVKLDIDYPFHSSALEVTRGQLNDVLHDLRPGSERVTFISTVTGETVAGQDLGANYWWRNIRQPVLFRQAVEHAADRGFDLYVEISPKSILASALGDNLKSLNSPASVISSLTSNANQGFDEIESLVAFMLSQGVAVDTEAVFGKPLTQPSSMPGYPFQRQHYAISSTPEALQVYGGLIGSPPQHPLLGARMAGGAPEWRNLLDPSRLPYLADHRVDHGVVVPAAAFVEMALAAGRDIHGKVPLELDEFDIIKALALAPGAIREVSTRYSEGISEVEVWSRERFSDNDWILHARGTLRVLARQKKTALLLPAGDQLIQDNAENIYAEATRAGLDYGPLFQLVTKSERDEYTTHARMKAPGGLGIYEDCHVINPISFDAAFHALFVSRPQKEGETKAHLPVRFRKICVWEHGAEISQSITHLTRETDRHKAVAISLLNENGDVVASVEAAVLRSVYFSKATVADRTFVAEWLPVSEAVSVDESVKEIRRAIGSNVLPPPDAWLLTRAFAVSLACRILAELTERHASQSLSTLPDVMKLSDRAASYFDSLLNVVAEQGLIDHSGICLKDDIDLPPPEALLATLVQRFPEASVEIQLAATALEHAEEFLLDDIIPNVPQSLLWRFESMSQLVAPAVDALRNAVQILVEQSPRKLSLLVIEPWSSGLLRVLIPFARSGLVELTLATSDRAAIDLCRRDIDPNVSISYLLIGQPMPPLPKRFDALIGLATTEVGESQSDLKTAVNSLLLTGAPLIVAVPGNEPTLEMLAGFWPKWFQRSVAGFSLSRIPSASHVASALREAGGSDVEMLKLGECTGYLVSALRSGEVSAPISPERKASFIIAQDEATVSRFKLMEIERLGVADCAEELSHRLAELPAETEAVIYVAPHDQDKPPADQLADRIETLKALLQTVEKSEREVTICIVTEGAHTSATGNFPVECGVYGFGRVAINEFPSIDIRLVDLSPGATMENAPEMLNSNGGEREFLITWEGVCVNRVKRGLHVDEQLAGNERSVLRFPNPGRIDNFEWTKEPRCAPGFEEVEIEVAAVGLNFRDILVGLGILDDDLLGAGLTGAALGFECSGTVVRTGEGVANLKVGDLVMGFTAGAMASHIVSPSWHFFPVPQGLSLDEAATIPVAFTTAWYGLIERAGLKSGEDVLIHGAAGGVGLAATQIAARAGARVIGSASSPARRAVARAAGASLGCDSRKERFAEYIRENLGGVDVVLNSLAGQAMLSSFNLIKPFGRFIELGKRDYLSNTALGLRPFVRNIMYCGVDLDELLAHDRCAVERIMMKLADLFARGELHPLPIQVFEPGEVADAFRTMQASEHIGKIILRPAKSASRSFEAHELTLKEGAYLIIGGTSGLGFATARWLVGKGASTIVLASRRGAIEDVLADDYAKLLRSGANIVVERLDVLDAKAVAGCVRNISARYGPLRGVVHAAVQLDDGLISGLEPQRLRAVLRTKIEGAINLDQATRGIPLDFFVVYSSATTLIGSPGQSAYVAANAFLEGFARQRRAQGLPALAIGWGAISDVGIIARDHSLGQRLRRTTGVVSIKSSEALAHLGRLLSMGNDAGPIQFYTNVAPSSAVDKLALLNSPTFAALDLARHELNSEDGEDLTSAIAGKSQAEALEIVVQALRREMAHILRVNEAQIDTRRPLTELGFDSLMALELHMSIERLAGVEVPMMGAADRNLGSISLAILQQLTVSDARAENENGLGATAAEIQIISLASRHSAVELSLDDARRLREKIAG